MASKNGNFYKTTVEITFNGKKVRVSPDVAKALEKKSNKSPNKKEDKK
mgnify:CR=1 FL=1|jgi:hypothetical protein